MPYKLITPPAVEPITLAEAKQHCRVDVADDDALLGALITAARLQAESITGRVMIEQQWRYDINCFNGEEIEIPYPPLKSIQSITYLDSAGARQTLATTDYQVVTDVMVGYVVPTYGTRWPTVRETPDSVQISFTCGYGNAAAVPQAIKQWMLLAIGTWYANRDGISASPVEIMPSCAWNSLLEPYRVMRF